ncbi:MAG: type II toxin-antitoxin system HicA family toxin [Alphaproteobacteria bacterium]
MKTKEALRRLRRLGVETGGQTGSHLKLYHRGRRSIIPMHTGEIKTGTLYAILKQLGIDRQDFMEI